MWGLTINDKHTFDDFGLCCLSCTLDPPEPRLYTIDIPGADGVLDATAARGRVTYKNRTLTAEFDCVYESRTSYDAACAALNTAHHGRLVELLTDSDPQHVLTGRAAWEHTVDGLAATHTLTVDCQPYRMALLPTEKTYVLTGEELPRWLKQLKLMAAGGLTLTLMTVVLVLAPLYQDGNGWYVMLCTSSMLYHHLLNPLAAMVSFVLLERQPRLPRSATVWALLPTVVYGSIILMLNLQRKVEGPYPFLQVYNQSVPMTILWCILMLGTNYLYVWLLWRLGGNARKTN